MTDPDNQNDTITKDKPTTFIPLTVKDKSFPDLPEFNESKTLFSEIRIKPSNILNRQIKVKTFLLFSTLIFLSLIFLIVIIVSLIIKSASVPIKITEYPYGTPKNTTYIFGHRNPDSDSIISAIVMSYFEKQLGNLNNIIPCRLGNVTPETEFILSSFNVPPPKLIENTTGADNLILVDHSYLDLSVRDIKTTKAKILKIIDHHGVFGFEYNDAITYISRPFGATCTVLYQLFKIFDIKITKSLAGIMVGAIISDTILLKSSTTTQYDIDAIKDLSIIAGIDYQKFGNEVLKVATDVSMYDESQLILLDSKNYTMNGHRVILSEIKVLEFDSILAKKKKIVKEMEKYVKKNNYDLFMVYMVDVININSEGFVVGEYAKVIEDAFGVKVEDNVVFLKGVSSRKKDIMPRLGETFQKY